MWSVGLCVVALGIVFITHWAFKWRNSKFHGVLPPGSMGFPLLGETLYLFIPSRSLDVHSFIKKRIQRYGPVFKTSLAGRPVVISADPEFNHFIFQHEGESVELWYLGTFAKLFNLKDESGATTPVGSVHKYLRSIISNHFGLESLKKHLIPQLEEMLSKTLRKWSSQASVEVKDAVTTMVFDFNANHMFGYDYENSSEKAQEKVKNMIAKKLNERRNSSDKCQEDLLDQAIKDLNTEKFLTDDFISGLIFGVLFASSESLSSALTLAFKLLSDHPPVVDELIAEHEAILTNRENLESSLSWEEYKSMTFTHQVVSEILRLANASPGLFRRATKDIQVNGYTIPAGWSIIIATSAHQLNPSIFNDPLEFNPWRWKDVDSSLVSRNFMPFGRGTRQCAGAEFSKAFMATFLHVLITKYRWTKIEGGKIGRTPFLSFGNGIHIKVSEVMTEDCLSEAI